MVSHQRLQSTSSAGNNNNNDDTESNIRTEDACTSPSDVTGDWGPIQRRILIFLTICDLIAPFNNNSITFYLQHNDFYCHYYNQSSRGYDVVKNTCLQSDSGSNATCEFYSHSRDTYRRTLVDTYDLVCDRHMFGPLAQSLQQVGSLMSGYLIGALSDSFGRVKAARMSMSLEIIAGFVQVFAPNIIVFSAARFVTGFAGYGRYMTGYVLVNEWMGSKSRSRAAVLYVFGSNVGCLLLALAFHFYSDFRIIQAAVSSFEVLLLLAHILLVLESPRWLLTQERYDEAGSIMRKAGRAKNHLPESEISSRIKSIELHHRAITSSSSSDGENNTTGEKKKCVKGILQLMKSPDLRSVTAILLFTWTVQTFIGSASTFNISSLGGSVSLNFVIDTLSSTLANSVILVVVHRFERRSLMRSTMFFEAIGLVALMACSFQSDLYIYRLIFHFMFSAGRSATNRVYQLYTAESFPTTMRQTAIGICALCGGLAGTLAPFVKELNSHIHSAYVQAIYLSLTTANLMLVLLLPETGDTELPDVIPDVDRERTDSSCH